MDAQQRALRDKQELEMSEMVSILLACVNREAEVLIGLDFSMVFVLDVRRWIWRRSARSGPPRGLLP